MFDIPEKNPIPPNLPAVAVFITDTPFTVKVFATGHNELVIPPLRAVAALELRVQAEVKVRAL